jgi:hypothetical protein
VERIAIEAKKASSGRTFVGVRAEEPRIFGDFTNWDYLGSNYVKGAGTGKNSNWCFGEPNRVDEKCMDISGTPVCWNDISCSILLPFICGPFPVCERE